MSVLIDWQSLCRGLILIIMILLSITGAIGHGKSSLAEALTAIEPTAQHNESFWLISSFATQAKKTLPASTDLKAINRWLSQLIPAIQQQLLPTATVQDLLITAQQTKLQPIEYQKLWQYIDLLNQHPERRLETITDANKPFHRPILQWIGGFFIQRLSPTVWYDQLVHQAKQTKESGCQLYVIGGLRFPAEAEVIHAANGQVIKIVRPTQEVSESQDPTERDRQQVKPDTTVVNNGSLRDLEAVAQRIITDIKLKQLASEYSARSD